MRWVIPGPRLDPQHSRWFDRSIAAAGEGTTRNQVVDGIPSNGLEASVHHTRGGAEAIDNIRADDTNGLGSKRPGEVVVANHCRSWSGHG